MIDQLGTGPRSAVLERSLSRTDIFGDFYMIFKAMELGEIIRRERALGPFMIMRPERRGGDNKGV